MENSHHSHPLIGTWVLLSYAAPDHPEAGHWGKVISVFNFEGEQTELKVKFSDEKIYWLPIIYLAHGNPPGPFIPGEPI